MKRQRLLVEAARYTETAVKFIIAGSGSQKELDYINAYIEKYSLKDKVKLVGFISEEEKINYYANCLAAYTSLSQKHIDWDFVIEKLLK